MPDILVIDDDQIFCETMVQILTRLGYRADAAHTLAQGQTMAESGNFDVVLLDVNLPDGNGLEAIPRFRQAPSAPDIIIITGGSSPDGAALAIQSGSWDYLPKPFTLEQIRFALERVVQYRCEKIAPPKTVSLKPAGIIGSSPSLRACLDLTAAAAMSDTTVLITGETGTGKELFARAIHSQGLRAAHDMVVVDCAALPETLVESILFGHAKGSFTGADKARVGLIEQADGGTLFLDEIGELPLAMQGSFLRVLQERRFRPVGGKQEIQSDFRLIAATNRNLDQMVAKGHFRGDLLYRINGIHIELPPLRSRVEDITELTLHIMNDFCERLGWGLKGLAAEFIEALRVYSWPGNVRELNNAMEHALSTAESAPMLYPIHLPVKIRSVLARVTMEAARQSADDDGEEIGLQPTPVVDTPTEFPPLKTVLAEVEAKYLQDLLVYAAGDMKKACRASGVSRSRLYARLKQYGISRS